MGYLNPMRGTVKVELPDGYWVVLRHLSMDESDKHGEIQDDTEKVIQGLATAAVDWNLDDENGQKFGKEALPQVFRDMPQGDFVKLSIAFARNEGISDAQLDASLEAARASRSQFRGGSERGAADGQARPADTPGVPPAPDALGAAGNAAGADAQLAS
jgi:hypothetical protein